MNIKYIDLTVSGKVSLVDDIMDDLNDGNGDYSMDDITMLEGILEKVEDLLENLGC